MSLSHLGVDLIPVHVLLEHYGLNPHMKDTVLETEVLDSGTFKVVSVDGLLGVWRQSSLEATIVIVELLSILDLFIKVLLIDDCLILGSLPLHELIWEALETSVLLLDHFIDMNLFLLLNLIRLLCWQPIYHIHEVFIDFVPINFLLALVMDCLH